MRVLTFSVLLLWAGSFFVQTLRHCRSPAGYFGGAMILTVGVVGLLKITTNVDCPWDLTEFGGRFPYADLFSARPAKPPRGRCFPAAHASSGYAMMGLYFLGYERSRTLARTGLAIGLLLGAIFGVAQQSHGAHFVSHDLWSASFGWMIPLTFYTVAFGGNLYARSQPAAAHCSRVPERHSHRFMRLMRRKPRNNSSDSPLETCSTTSVRKA